MTGVVGRAELLSAAFSLVAFLVYSNSISRSGKTGTVFHMPSHNVVAHYSFKLFLSLNGTVDHESSKIQRALDGFSLWQTTFLVLRYNVYV